MLIVVAFELALINNNIILLNNNFVKALAEVVKEIKRK